MAAMMALVNSVSVRRGLESLQEGGSAIIVFEEAATFGSW